MTTTAIAKPRPGRLFRKQHHPAALLSVAVVTNDWTALVL
jgi:hypothetical protein